jgi:DNA-directed RNA polymerase specialized sigma24 family protein
VEVIGIESGSASQGWETLASSSAAALMRLALMLTGDLADAEDLLQSTFVRASRHGERIASMAAPMAYLRRVMVDEHASWRRRRGAAGDPDAGHGRDRGDPADRGGLPDAGGHPHHVRPRRVRLRRAAGRRLGVPAQGRSPEQLLTAVQVAAAGDALIAPPVTKRLLSEFVRRPDPSAGEEAAKALTAREREVLLGLARGLSNAEIAAELFLGEATIKSHVAAVLSKLGLHDRIQAVVFAYESGLVRPGDSRPV